MRVAVSQSRGQFWNQKEVERPPLEAVTRRLVNTQLTEKTKCLQ
jgi:hypothetical protein